MQAPREAPFKMAIRRIQGLIVPSSCVRKGRNPMEIPLIPTHHTTGCPAGFLPLRAICCQSQPPMPTNAVIPIFM